ncbi:MAG: tetratricopeptide repeat protein, partial [Candidatus Aureabacteria bacterium]|nr:tetratricopeptide repeat protein [Candidatus Auribacterota bacterium]
MSKSLRSLAVALLFLVVFAASFHRVEDYDIWMHLKSGEWMAAHKDVLREDVFSYTIAGRRWINHQWLAQVLLFLIQRAGGFNGLILFASAAVLAAVALLFSIVYRPGTRRLSVLACLAAILAAESRFLTRPEIFTLFLAAVFFAVLSRAAADGKKTRGLILLIPLGALWSNLHAGFVIGIGLVWAFALGTAGERGLRRRWAGYRGGTAETIRPAPFFLAALLVALAAGLNPFGWSLLLEPFRQALSPVFMKEIGEWSPPFLPGPLGGGVGIDVYAVLIGVSALSFPLSGRRLNLPYLLIYLPLLFLSLRSRRSIALFSLLSFPMTVANLNPLLSRLARTRITWAGRAVLYRPGRPFWRALGAGATLALISGELLLLFWIATDRYYVFDNNSRVFGTGVRWEAFPRDASVFIRARFPGRVFNDYDIGCFLIWSLFPERTVFIDGRNLLYGEEFLARPYKWVLQDPGRWDQFVREYGIELAVIRHAAFDVKELLRNLCRDREWPMVYLDDSTVVFAHRTPESATAIEGARVELERERGRREREPPEVPARGLFRKVIFPFGVLQRAGFFMLVDDYRSAAEEYERAAVIYPFSPEIFNHLGIARKKAGEPERAERAWARAIELRPAYPAPWNNLGLLYLERERTPEALAAFERIFAMDDSFLDAYNNAGLCYLKMNRPALARRMWERAL